MRTPSSLPLRFTTALTLVCVFTACADQPSATIDGPPLRVAPGPAIAARGFVATGVPSQRRSNLFSTLSDAELSLAVAKAGNRAFIGFKEADATDGVDPFGRVLTSASTSESLKNQLRALSVRIDYEFKRMPGVIARVPSSSLVVSLRHNPRVDYIEPVMTGGQLGSQVTPTGDYTVQAVQAWPLSTGSGVKVLIIDSGMAAHEDLFVGVRFRCVDASLPTYDEIGHGTHVGGIVGAINNDIGVVGMAYGAQIWAANVVNRTGAPDNGEIACAIDVGRVNGIFAYNMSLGVFNTTAINDAIRGAYYQDGSLFFACVGNDYGGPVWYPASLAEVVGVTSVDFYNQHSIFANVGSKVELSAPGESVLSTAIPNGVLCGGGGNPYSFCTGTSMASPAGAAAAAILKAYNPSWSNIDIRNRLDNNALSLGDPNLYGRGLIQIYSALTAP